MNLPEIHLLIEQRRLTDVIYNMCMKQALDVMTVSAGVSMYSWIFTFSEGNGSRACLRKKSQCRNNVVLEALPGCCFHLKVRSEIFLHLLPLCRLHVVFSSIRDGFVFHAHFTDNGGFPWCKDVREDKVVI